MKKFGIALISLGIYCAIFAFNVDVVIGTTYNIGLLNERQNIIYLSGIIFLAGIILFGFGVVVKEESKNLKKFVFLCSLPFLCFLVIKAYYIRQYVLAEEQKIKHEYEKSYQEIQDKNIEEENKKEIEKAESSYQMTLNSTEFVDMGNGSVFDNKTDLTWQRCHVGEKWKDSTCIGIADLVVWEDATKIKDTLANKNDWRLPTKKELETLLFCSNNVCTINTDIFSNNAKTRVWSSSSDNQHFGNVWYVDFRTGIPISTFIEGDNLRVRLVRNGK